MNTHLLTLKSSLILFILLNSNLVSSQTKPVFDVPSWQAPYQLSLDGWGIAI
ncbi:hypothetical protein [Pedobacter cryoconitis]|uniref:Uncharacterized protein n=1 Tax=Pedobacter cryoconitis TaxID=188932 RepID=A0A7X0MKS0_9SPHI|nr:hypothetical protein [Pedobacter cryoconitis]MBB6501005.1 hypothetical protein [Pedobacter cryoconitis]